jgi:hypothetical protein
VKADVFAAYCDLLRQVSAWVRGLVFGVLCLREQPRYASYKDAQLACSSVIPKSVPTLSGICQPRR